MTKTLLLCACVGTLGSAAAAGQIAISDIGGGIVLNSGPLFASAFGNDQTAWTTASLSAVNLSLNAAGIVTNGRVTIIAADTDRGLSLMAIVDQELGGGVASMGNLNIDSSANGSNLAYCANTGGGITVTPNGFGSRTASGNFVWNSNGSGDGFAWAGLNAGNAITMRFNRVSGQTLGLNDPGTFQFVTWTGTTWAAVTVPSALQSFTQSNDFGFSASVLVPAPSSAALAGLAMLPLLRRRRA